MTVADLLKLNVKKYTEKKGDLTYLSWSWAWAQALQADPAATFKVEMFDGKPYLEINGTAMVFVTATMFGKPVTCQLPVMNSRNDPISIEGRRYKDKYGNEKVEKIDSFNVNTAIMRCLAKALSLHGLGLYIYAGEDLPNFDDVEEKTDEGIKKKGDAPVITPRGGIGDDLPDDVKSYLTDLSVECTDLVNEGRAKEANQKLESENLDPDQKIWLWNQLASHVRTKLTKAKGM